MFNAQPTRTLISTLERDGQHTDMRDTIEENVSEETILVGRMLSNFPLTFVSKNVYSPRHF